MANSATDIFTSAARLESLSKRWLLEDNSPHHYGLLYDCGNSRNGKGYQEVTDSTDPEVLAIKREFDKIPSDKNVPDLPEDGPINVNPRKREPAGRKKAKR